MFNFFNINETTTYEELITILHYATIYFDTDLKLNKEKGDREKLARAVNRVKENLTPDERQVCDPVRLDKALENFLTAEKNKKPLTNLTWDDPRLYINRADVIFKSTKNLSTSTSSDEDRNCIYFINQACHHYKMGLRLAKILEDREKKENAKREGVNANEKNNIDDKIKLIKDAQQGKENCDKLYSEYNERFKSDQILNKKIQSNSFIKNISKSFQLFYQSFSARKISSSTNVNQGLKKSNIFFENTSALNGKHLISTTQTRINLFNNKAINNLTLSEVTNDPEKYRNVTLNISLMNVDLFKGINNPQDKINLCLNWSDYILKNRKNWTDENVQLNLVLSYYKLALSNAIQVKDYQAIVQIKIGMGQCYKSLGLHEAAKNAILQTGLNDPKIIECLNAEKNKKKFDLITLLLGYNISRSSQQDNVFGAYSKEEKINIVTSLINYLLLNANANLDPKHIGPLTQGRLGKSLKNWVKANMNNEDDKENKKSILPVNLYEAIRKEIKEEARRNENIFTYTYITRI